MLAVDEENDLALLFSKYMIDAWCMANQDSAGSWAYNASTTARKYLNGSWLEDHTTLLQVAQETEISFYRAVRYDRATEEEPYGVWVDSSLDKVFLPSYADLTGLDAAQEMSYPTFDPDPAGEYTWENRQIVPDSLQYTGNAAGVSGTGSTYWLRTAVLDGAYETSFIEVTNYSGANIQVPGREDTTREQGLRPMMWVRISEE